MRVLIAGATGFIGTSLAHRLASEEHDVRCIVRDTRSDGAERLSRDGFDLHEGDVTDAESLQGAGRDVDAAYYLVHSMGDGDGGTDFTQRDREAATVFATMADAEHVGRVIYLGGLGDPDESEHLKSRRDTARALQEHGPALTHFRASMIVGAQSDSYQMLSALVQRIPVTVVPRWLENEVQPIGINDTIRYLADALRIDATKGREIQIGGSDTVTYLQLLDRMAHALGLRARPKLRIPFLSPQHAAPIVGLLTPVEATIARPLVKGLATSTIVTDDSGMKLFDFTPSALDAILRLAADEARPDTRGCAVGATARAA